MTTFLIITNILLIAVIISLVDDDLKSVIKTTAHFNSELITKRGAEIKLLSDDVQRLIKSVEQQDYAILGQNKAVTELKEAFNLNSVNTKNAIESLKKQGQVIEIAPEKLRPLIKEVIETVQDMPIIVNQEK